MDVDIFLLKDVNFKIADAQYFPIKNPAKTITVLHSGYCGSSVSFYNGHFLDKVCRTGILVNDEERIPDVHRDRPL